MLTTCSDYLTPWACARRGNNSQDQTVVTGTDKCNVWTHTMYRRPFPNTLLTTVEPIYSGHLSWLKVSSFQGLFYILLRITGTMHGVLCPYRGVHYILPYIPRSFQFRAFKFWIILIPTLKMCQCASCMQNNGWTSYEIWERVRRIFLICFSQYTFQSKLTNAHVRRNRLHCGERLLKWKIHCPE